jgi:hypothetical protein
VFRAFGFNAATAVLLYLLDIVWQSVRPKDKWKTVQLGALFMWRGLPI